MTTIAEQIAAVQSAISMRESWSTGYNGEVDRENDARIAALRAVLATLEAHERAFSYLRYLLSVISPSTEPLPDLVGMCTQIDHLYDDGVRQREDIALRERDEAVAEAARLREAIDYPIAPLRKALSHAGIAAPPSDEELAFAWPEYAQKVIRWAERRFDASPSPAYTEPVAILEAYERAEQGAMEAEKTRRFLNLPETRPELLELIRQATERFNAMTPEQQEAELKAQRESWVRGNLGWD